MNPEELRAQLRDLLQQYVGVAGPDDPAAQAAGQLLATIEAADAGGGGMESAMGMGAPAAPPAPDMAGMMPPGGDLMPPPEEAPIEEEEAPARRGGSPGNEGFDKARAGAKDFLKKKKGSKAA